MRVPVVRYPLFWLLGGMALFVGFNAARPALQQLRSRTEQKITRLVEGPPVPRSDRPQVLAGPILRRGLLLHDEVEVFDRPRGRVVETLRRRVFVDIYDVWSMSGPPTHVRVGNRGPVGWVATIDVLPWDTRLVLQPESRKLPESPEPGGVPRDREVAPGVPLPIVGWQGENVQVAFWTPEADRFQLRGRGWVRLVADGDTDRIGVLLSRVELLALLQRVLTDDSPAARSEARLRAILGRLAGTDSISRSDQETAYKALPAWARPTSPAATSPSRLTETLSRLNENWKPTLGWSGVDYIFLPLKALP